VWNAHNTVLGSKHLPIYMCHLTQCRLCWGLPLYQVAFWSIQLFGHNRHRPKFRGLLCPLWGAWFPSNTTWSGPTRTSIVHTKWHVDPPSRFTTIDMGQKMGGCCSLVKCLNYTVKIWTAINCTVITNRNPNHNHNPNRFWLSRFQLYRHRWGISLSRIWLSRYCTEPLHVRKCLHVGIYNSSHCMSETRRAGRKNITSGTRRAVSNTKRREVSFFSAHKRPSPFFLYIPHKNPLLNR